MKTKYIFSILALTLGLTACDNYFDEKYLDNGNPQVKVVKTYEYSLLPADYASIANNATNKEIAAELDSLKGLKNRYQNALARVGKEGCFNLNATPDKYVPIFIYNRFPQLDAGSTFNIFYLSDDGLPQYLQPYNTAERVVLDVTTKAEVLPLLPQPDEGQVIGALYGENSDQEVLFCCENGSSWTELVFPAGQNFYLLPLEAKGQVEKWLQVNFPYAEIDQVEAVVSYDEESAHYIAYEYVFDGEAWVANTGVVEETMMFTLDAKKGWITDLSTYYQQAVAGDGDKGKIVTQDFDLEDGISYIWIYDNAYGMKGTAYAKGAPHYGEGWFVTPKIKLKNSIAPALSFDMAMNYGPLPEDGRYEQATVWVSTDYAGDVTKATWTQLPWNMFDGNTGFPDGNSWTFYNSGRMDLSAWNNQMIYIGFRYKSLPGQTCSTWEVKNILVNEPEVSEE